MLRENDIRTVAEKIGSPQAQAKVEELLLDAREGLFAAQMYMLGYLQGYLEEHLVGPEELRGYYHQLGYSSEEVAAIRRKNHVGN